MNHEVPSNVLALNITEEDLRTTPKPVIVNVVATYHLANQSIDMEKLTQQMPGYAFNPWKFAAGKWRTGRAMTLAFYRGCAVCPGSKSVMGARLSALKFTNMLLEVGEMTCYSRFKVQNIVCNSWFPKGLDLMAIFKKYSGNNEYNWGKFPGLAFRMKYPRVVFNLFTSGQVVITGSRDYVHSTLCWYWLYHNVLSQFHTGVSGTTKSAAAYKMETTRRTDTYAKDCESMAKRRARRPDGPVSQHAAEITASMAGEAPLFPAVPQDMLRTTFRDHRGTCPFISFPTGSNPKVVWETEKENLELALACADQTTCYMNTVLDPHVLAGCDHATTADATADKYIHELYVALSSFDDDDVETTAGASLKRGILPSIPLEDILNRETQYHLTLLHNISDTDESMKFCM